MEPIGDYDSFDINDNDNLTFVRKNEVIGLGNINEGLDSPSKMINPILDRVWAHPILYRGGGKKPLRVNSAI